MKYKIIWNPISLLWIMILSLWAHTSQQKSDYCTLAWYYLASHSKTTKAVWRTVVNLLFFSYCSIHFYYILYYNKNYKDFNHSLHKRMFCFFQITYCLRAESHIFCIACILLFSLLVTGYSLITVFFRFGKFLGLQLHNL